LLLVRYSVFESAELQRIGADLSVTGNLSFKSSQVDQAVLDSLITILHKSEIASSPRLRTSQRVSICAASRTSSTSRRCVHFRSRL